MPSRIRYQIDHWRPANRYRCDCTNQTPAHHHHQVPRRKPASERPGRTDSFAALSHHVSSLPSHDERMAALGILQEKQSVAWKHTKCGTRGFTRETSSLPAEPHWRTLPPSARQVMRHRPVPERGEADDAIRWARARVAVTAAKQAKPVASRRRHHHGVGGESHLPGQPLIPCDSH